MPKQVCQINPVTGEYIGQATAYENPQAHLDGVPFNIPGSCFDMKPPEARPGFAAVKEGAAWKYVEDHRGKIMFSTADKSSKHVTELGGIPDGFTLLIPGPFSVWKKSAWVVDEAAKTAAEIKSNNAPILAALQENDAATVRSIREWIAAQPDAPKFILDHEKTAQETRKGLQK